MSTTRVLVRGQSRFHAVALKGFERGQNFLLARAPHDLDESFALDKVKQRWNDVDVIPKAEVGTGVGIDFDHLRFAGQCSRDLFQDQVEDLTRPTPGRPELNQDRLLRLQDLCPEIAFFDLAGPCLVAASVHFSIVIRFYSHSGTTRASRHRSA